MKRMKNAAAFADDLQKISDREFVETLQTALLNATGCGIQESMSGEEWPCGTCVCSLLGRLMDRTAPEYGEHNQPVDRVNEVWRAIVQIRDWK